MKKLTLNIKYCNDCPFRQWHESSFICTKSMRVIYMVEGEGFIEMWNKPQFTNENIGIIEIPEWCTLEDN